MEHMMNGRIKYSSTSEIKHYLYQFSIGIPLGSSFYGDYCFEMKFAKIKKNEYEQSKSVFIAKAKDEKLEIETKWVSLTEDLEESLAIMKKILRRELGYYQENYEEEEEIRIEKELVLEKVREYQAVKEYISLPFGPGSDELIDKSKIIERKELVHGVECGPYVFFYDIVNQKVKQCSTNKIKWHKYSNFDRNEQESPTPYVEERDELNSEYWRNHAISNPNE